MAKSTAAMLLAAALAISCHAVAAASGKVVQSVLFHRHGDR